MAQSAAAIHIGMARIFLGVTAPATGAPPTMMAHTDGVPSSGTEVGYTNGVSTFTYKQNKQEVDAEQSLNPVDVFITNEMAQLEFTAMEHTYNTLKTAFDNIGTVQDADKMLFYAGDGSGLVSVTTQSVCLTSRRRDDTTKFEVLTLYRVYNVEGIVIGYLKTQPAQYKVTLKALVDQSRDPGDRVFQWFKELSPAAGGFAARGLTPGRGGIGQPGPGQPKPGVPEKPGSGLPEKPGTGLPEKPGTPDRETPSPTSGREK